MLFDITPTKKLIMTYKKISLILVGLMWTNFICAQNPVSQKDDFCYAKLKSPDLYQEITEKVMVTPASIRTIKVPAEYSTISEQIMINLK